MKTELEEAAECLSLHSEVDFVKGANWQAKKMYSEEEVKNIAYWAFDFYKRNDLDDEELENEFERMLNERFKKK
jgi:hypothetical protein